MQMLGRKVMAAGNLADQVNGNGNIERVPIMSLGMDVAATAVVPSTTMIEVPAAQLAKMAFINKVRHRVSALLPVPRTPNVRRPELQGMSPLQGAVIGWQELMLNSPWETSPEDRQSG
jgi:hypothetical protein